MAPSDSHFPTFLPLASFSDFPAPPLVVPNSDFDSSTISAPVLVSYVIEESRDDGELSPSLSGLVAAHSSAVSPDLDSDVGASAQEWGSEGFRPPWGLPNKPPPADEGLEWFTTADNWARQQAYCDRGKSSFSPPSKLPVENLFSQQYEGQLPFLRDHRLADFSSRRRGERFETTQGVEVSSGFAKDVRATSGGSCDGEHDRSTNDLQHSRGSVSPLAFLSSTSGHSSPFSSDVRSDSLPEAQRVGDLEDARLSSGGTCDGEHHSHKDVLQHTLVSVSSSRSQLNVATHQSRSSSDAEFDALLEAQRMADLAIPAAESINHPKRKREVLSDHAYRLRKERTDNLLEGYRSVTLRRSPRLKNKALPEDYDPPPPNLGRGSDSDSEDPDSSIAGLRDCLGGLTVNGKSRTRTVLTIRQIRRVMAAKESLF